MTRLTRTRGVVVRPMQIEDLDFAVSLTQTEEWALENYAEFVVFFAYHPTGCLLAEWNGTSAGIVIATPYGEAGFIGELIVRAEMRGRGFGRTLLDAAVANLREHGVRTVYLDGVAKAVSTYERAGFRKLTPSLRFVRQGDSNLASQPFAEGVRPMQPEDLPAVLALDQELFGADRSYFLRYRFEMTPRLAWVQIRGERIAGYAFGREIPELAWVGPWAVTEEGDPAGLLQAVIPADPGRWLAAGALASNERAIALYKDVGFEQRANPAWRMALGPDENLGMHPALFGVGTAAKG